MLWRTCIPAEGAAPVWSSPRVPCLGQVCMAGKGAVSVRSVKHWECWDYLHSSFLWSNTSLCGYFSSESSGCYPQSSGFSKYTCFLSVFLRSQREWANAHTTVSFPAWSLGREMAGLFFVCPDSCSLATPHSPIPLVNKGWETVLLETSLVVPRRQKVAFPVYYLYKFAFIHPVEAHLSQVLER